MVVIEVKNLKKYFGKVKAVDDISFTVEQGEIFGFLGPNGAGKTTTIRCMTDFIRPDSGTIKILDKDTQKEIDELKREMTYLASGMQYYSNWTGRDHLELIESLRGGDGRVKEYAKRLDFNINIKAKALSSGNKQKLGILMALVNQPKVLILDEPTIGLDPLLQNTFYEVIRELANAGTTVFMSSHYLHEVEEVCGRVAIIKEGKLIAVESIRNLKQKRIYIATISFENDFKAEEFKLQGVEIREKHDRELVLSVKGDINPLIRHLANYHLKTAEIVQAPLDEIFLEYYEKK